VANNSLQIYAEAFSVVPLLHVPADKPIRVLSVGPYALPLAKLALRYPATTEVVLASIDTAPAPTDKRVKVVKTLDGVSGTFDVLGMALPGEAYGLLPQVKKLLAPGGVLVFAVDQFQRGRQAKDALRPLWGHIFPYREFTPDPSLFFLCSDEKIRPDQRPMPQNLYRLTPKYLPVLFTFAKDEYNFLYGEKKT
jgi:hypothetical protein